ncbi:DUF808 domain-containing protein [Pseudoalteromonas xiamenensis]
MAGGSFFALLDDIVFLTKVAASKTAPVLGDDLAVNAQSLSGDIKPERELPVVWAVAKGSFLNKAIIVPIALALSFFLPFLIQPLLMLGGLFLCYEGSEKFLHLFKKSAHHEALLAAVQDENVSLLEFEKEKIKDAIKMDTVLSAEIIVIALGSIQDQTIMMQIIVLSIIAVIMTVGVYGLVGLFVKLDDIALHIIRNEVKKRASGFKYLFGRGLLSLATQLMSLLSFIGMVACLLIGGEILSHGLPFLSHYIDSLTISNSMIKTLFSLSFNAVLGFCAGVVVVGLIKASGKMFKSKTE